MSGNLSPLNDRVLIMPIDEGEKMHGNIIVPDLGKERAEIGRVIAVGPGRVSEFGTFIPINVEVGDIVLVPKIGSLRVDYEGQEYYITQDREILAKVKTIKEENAE